VSFVPVYLRDEIEMRRGAEAPFARGAPEEPESALMNDLLKNDPLPGGSFSLGNRRFNLILGLE
jgi:hypothetical protein